MTRYLLRWVRYLLWRVGYLLLLRRVRQLKPHNRIVNENRGIDHLIYLLFISLYFGSYFYVYLSWEDFRYSILLYLLIFLPDLFIMLNLLFKTVRRSGIGTSNYIAIAEVGIIQLT